MSGQGKMIWPDGRTYFGQFDKNMMNGKGNLQHGPDQKEYYGQFKNDQYHGFGIQTNPKAIGMEPVKYQGLW